MCELLALSFNLPIRASLSFRGFRHRGEDNPDGWGIARFEEHACQVFKEPINSLKSSLAAFLRDYESLRSTLFIGHVRLASRGVAALKNTHPFVRTFRAREIALAHNGTLSDVVARSSLKFHPVGDTDSEYLLCAILTRLSDDQIAFEDFHRIESLLREFNHHGTMNVLFSDGEYLYVYRDKRGYNGLCMTERVAPYSRVILEDDDWEVDLDDQKAPEQRGCVVATRPLTNERWADLRPGSLSVFKSGDRSYGA
jgi:predicted glutamine amidotransferase